MEGISKDKQLLPFLLVLLQLFCCFLVKGSLAQQCSTLGLVQNCGLACIAQVPTTPQVLTIPTNGSDLVSIIPLNQSSIVTFVLNGLNGQYNPTPSQNATSFIFWVNANEGAQEVEARISYDWTGDGTYDRLELYPSFAMNNVPSDFESYVAAMDSSTPRVITGSNAAFATLSNGKLRVEFWQSNGGGVFNGSVTMRTDGRGSFQMSNLSIPYTSASGPSYCGTGLAGVTTGSQSHQTTPPINSTTTAVVASAGAGSDSGSDSGNMVIKKLKDTNWHIYAGVGAGIVLLVIIIVIVVVVVKKRKDTSLNADYF